MSEFNQMNKIMYDTQAKEYVRVSNGKCTLDHSSPEAFKRAHGGTGSCDFAPCEAVALRVFMGDCCSVQIGWTYRAVDPAKLQAVSADLRLSVACTFDHVQAESAKPARKADILGVQYIGRV